MFGGLTTTELTAFAVSHVRNDIAIPTDLAIELGLRGVYPEMLEAAVEFVAEVEAWDDAYDMSVVDFVEVIDFDAEDIANFAIGGTD